MQSIDETLDIELKEFYINEELLPDKKSDILNKIMEGKFYSNNIVIKSIKFFIDKYFLKYLSAWNHTDFHFNCGKLYLGISDNGTFIGIPFQGDIKKDIIKSFILNQLDKTFLNKFEKLQLFNKIKITITKIKHHGLDTITEFKKILDKEQVRINQLREYNMKYIKWRNDLYKYGGKLIDFFNDTTQKNELLQFIIDNNPDKDNVIQLTNFLNSFTTLHELPDNGNVKLLKDDPTHIFYWITMYKDVMCCKIRSQKPYLEPYKKPNYKQFYSSPKYMNQFLEYTTNNIYFYVIRIDIPNLKKNILVKTKNGYIRYKRTISKTGPCSTPTSY